MTGSLCISREARIVIGMVLNGHVGERNRGDGQVWCPGKEH